MGCRLCGSDRVQKKFSLERFDVIQCKKCTLVFLSLTPTEAELNRLYSSDYFLQREEYYFKNIVAEPENGKYNENIDAFYLGLRKLNSLKPAKGRLLDLGCGLGVFLHMARAHGWDTCGVDISHFAVKYARERFGLKVYNDGRLAEEAFPSSSFDVITLWDSLEHFPDPVGQLHGINRILKDDGLIMLDIPNETSLLRGVARFVYAVTMGGFTYPVRKLYHHYHLYYFTPLALETLLKIGGFEILSVEKRTIPIVKARGSSFEKGLVKLLSYLERGLGLGYELFVIAKKSRDSCKNGMRTGNGC